MKKNLLNYLVCPSCQENLVLHKNYILKNDEIFSGKLICDKCNSIYLIERKAKGYREEKYYGFVFVPLK